MAFTTITADTALNDLDLALEISTALNKRCAVAGVTGITVPDVGTNVRTFIRACQEKIQAVAPSFSNPSATLAGQSALPSSWTLSAAMTAAGLTASGYWRRIPAAGSLPASWSSYSDAAYSYGLASEDDKIGPWLFSDLMAVLSKLTRHISDPDDTIVDYYGEEDRSGEDPDHPLWPSAATYELSGTVSLPYTAGSNDAGVVISKKSYRQGVFPPDPLFWASGWVSACRFLCPQNNIAGASETRTLVWLPNGSDPFTTLTGVSASAFNKTLTASPNQSESGYEGRYFPDTPANISALSVSWQTLSEMVDWPPTPDDGFTVNSLGFYVSRSDVVMVTDYGYGDGATS